MRNSSIANASLSDAQYGFQGSIKVFYSGLSNLNHRAFHSPNINTVSVVKTFPGLSLKLVRLSWDLRNLRMHLLPLLEP